MTNPFPFTSGNILNASELNAIGAWTTFTPTFNNVTLGGSGSANGVYTQVNDIVFWEAQFGLGGTGSVSGHINMNLPVGTSARSVLYPTAVTGWVQPAAAAISQVTGFTSATLIYFYAIVTSGTYAGVTALNNVAPSAWTSSGSLRVSGWYELA